MQAYLDTRCVMNACSEPQERLRDGQSNIYNRSLAALYSNTPMAKGGEEHSRLLDPTSMYECMQKIHVAIVAIHVLHVYNEMVTCLRNSRLNSR